MRFVDTWYKDFVAAVEISASHFSGWASGMAEYSLPLSQDPPALFNLGGDDAL